MTKKLLGTLHRELTRVAMLVAVGLLFITVSPILAMAVNIPALSPWGLFLGGAFFVAAISHVMRRALFPQLDLQLIAIHAMKNNSTAAAVVFLGICIVLASFIFVNGSMLRM